MSPFSRQVVSQSARVRWWRLCRPVPDRVANPAYNAGRDFLLTRPYKGRIEVCSFCGGDHTSIGHGGSHLRRMGSQDSGLTAASLARLDCWALRSLGTGTGQLRAMWPTSLQQKQRHCSGRLLCRGGV